MQHQTPAYRRIYGAKTYRRSQEELESSLEQIAAGAELLRREIPFARTRAETGHFIEGSLIGKAQTVLEIAHRIVTLSWQMEQNAEHMGPEEL